MENNRWLRMTLLQIAGFILIAGMVDRIILTEAFHLEKFLVKTLFAGLIFGIIMGYINYEKHKKSLQ